MPLLLEGDNNDNKIPSKAGKRVEKGTLSKSKPMAHSDILLATRLIQSSLDVLQKASNGNRSRHLGRFKLWADEYGTPHGQLDKILKESPILKEATVTLLADLCNILTTGTSRLDDILRKERFLALQDACTIYPGINQLFPDTDSDSGCEKDEIETIVDSLFDLSPLLVDILEDLPTDAPTGAGNSDEATAVSEAVRKFDASAYARRVRVSRLFLLGCLLLVHQMADHTGRFLMAPENLRRDWLK
ncbi:hypothetical protein B9Z19DRAFT_1063264 [Tuber borchii]|uniref:Uncharacterized protein n=1 Tax=Tuber borchii TaxID=42251 RepID=A0A2T6ZYT2_TUBBO|nr:hypothetical protein B9Z19DRAFT_1063264 [Tuber borchii]